MDADRSRGRLLEHNAVKRKAISTYLPMQHRTITFFSNILVDWVESGLKDGPARSFVLIDVILLKVKTSKGL